MSNKNKGNLSIDEITGAGADNLSKKSRKRAAREEKKK